MRQSKQEKITRDEILRLENERAALLQARDEARRLKAERKLVEKRLKEELRRQDEAARINEAARRSVEFERKLAEEEAERDHQRMIMQNRSEEIDRNVRGRRRSLVRPATAASPVAVNINLTGSSVPRQFSYTSRAPAVHFDSDFPGGLADLSDEDDRELSSSESSEFGRPMFAQRPLSAYSYGTAPFSDSSRYGLSPATARRDAARAASLREQFQAIEQAKQQRRKARFL